MKKDWKIKLRSIPLRQVRGNMGIRASRHSEETRGARHFRKGLVSRTLDATDLDADYILGMDASNVRNIHSFVDGKSDATVARLLEVGRSAARYRRSVVYRDFDATYRDVTLGCNALLEQLKRNYSMDKIKKDWAVMIGSGGCFVINRLEL